MPRPLYKTQMSSRRTTRGCGARSSTRWMRRRRTRRSTSAMWKVADGGLHPPGVWAYQPLPGRPSYDPQKAKQFLDAAGYPDGIDVNAIGYSGPELIQHSQIYVEQLKAVGINWKLKITDVGSSTSEFFQGREMPIYTTSWPGGGPADFWVRAVWGDGSFYGPSANANPDPRVNQLMDKAAATFDQEERQGGLPRVQPDRVRTGVVGVDDLRRRDHWHQQEGPEPRAAELREQLRAVALRGHVAGLAGLR